MVARHGVRIVATVAVVVAAVRAPVWLPIWAGKAEASVSALEGLAGLAALGVLLKDLALWLYRLWVPKPEPVPVSPSPVSVVHRVEGDGALATAPGARAVGRDGVLVETTGDHSPVTIDRSETHLHLPPDGPEPDTLRRQYLGQLLTDAGRVDLGALDPSVAAEEGRNAPRLESIYTSLRVQGWNPAQRKGRGQRELEFEGLPRELPSALAAVDQESRLVLLGDPGSGKSTFVRFLAVCLAGELLDREDVNLTLLRQGLPDDEGEPAEELQPWSHPARLPLVVTLRDFAEAEPGLPPAGTKASCEHLWAFLGSVLEANGPKGYLPALRDELSRKGGFVLFDGLDEVPQANARRTQLLAVIAAFAAAHPRCRVVVTSRTYAYQLPEWRLPDPFAVAELAPFDGGQIRRFVALWYADAAARKAIPQEAAPERRGSLLRAIFGHRHILDLARRPLLLTLMASLHAFRGRDLPERREQLYAETVELLLYRWEKQQRRLEKGKGERWEPSLSEWLETSRAAIRGVLEQLAFEVHAGQPELSGTADVAEKELVSRLLALRHQPTDNPALLLDYLRDRAGILVPRGVEVYSFPHRSFQEYLAASWLASRPDYPDELARRTRQEPERWREVALLAGATAAAKTPGPLWELVDTLCIRGPEEEGAGSADQWGAQIAGQALAERGPLGEVPERHQGKRGRVLSWLVRTLEGRELPARERALAGRNLAALGDPREWVTKLDAMQFCWVPPGKFWMGSPADDLEGYEDERPEHELDLEHGYWLGRYPVTVSQWREYAAASGVEVGDEASLRGQGNTPAVRVSWREALAFCRWLTARWCSEGLLAEGREVILPSEAEWEKAARGGWEVPESALLRSVRQMGLGAEEVALQPNDEPRRRYPWGDGFDGELANVEMNLGGLSAVGCFGAGRSPYGCEELSGNVWEWTRSTGGEYPYVPSERERISVDEKSSRVLRGGAFNGYARDARCSCRDWDPPNVRHHNVGFRVMLSPFLRSDL